MNLVGSWKFWALLSAFFASLTALFGKVGVLRVDSNLATWYRTFVIFVILGIFIFAKKMPITSLFSDFRTWVFLTLSALCTGASWVSYYRALQLGNVSQVAPVDKLSVVITVILAFIFLNEPVTMKVMIGTSLIFIGSLVMMF